jgi:hypothetical protein
MDESDSDPIAHTGNGIAGGHKQAGLVSLIALT